jgi:hypothetical protein
MLASVVPIIIRQLIWLKFFSSKRAGRPLDTLQAMGDFACIDSGLRPEITKRIEFGAHTHV